jgi:hypothetical protein
MSCYVATPSNSYEISRARSVSGRDLQSTIQTLTLLLLLNCVIMFFLEIFYVRVKLLHAELVKTFIQVVVVELTIFLNFS